MIYIFCKKLEAGVTIMNQRKFMLCDNNVIFKLMRNSLFPSRINESEIDRRSFQKCKLQNSRRVILAANPATFLDMTIARVTTKRAALKRVSFGTTEHLNNRLQAKIYATWMLV